MTVSSEVAGHAPILLLVTDVDGTLLTQDKVLTPRTIRAVDDLRDARVGLVVTSGRPPRGMAMLIDPLALKLPIPGFNGGVIVGPDLAIIKQHVLTFGVASQVLETIVSCGLTPWVYKGNDWFVLDSEGLHVAKEEHTVEFGPTLVQTFDGVLEGAVKVVGVSDDPEAVARCRTAIKSSIGGRVSASCSQTYYLDVTHPDADKGHVVDWISQFTGVPVNQIATIGDQGSDLFMFAKSGLSIAMGNASPDVKGRANKVTTSNQNEGFANAVEDFVLPRSGRAGARS